MIANLKDYRPEKIDFVIEPIVDEKFQSIKVLFAGAKTSEEIIDIVNDKFNATFPENETAFRRMDDYEINETREEFCLIQENQVPKALENLDETINTIKVMKKNAEEYYEGLLRQIRDLAAQVKNGTKEFALSSTNTIRFALDGFFLYYSWVDDVFQLVKAEKIPEWDRNSLWSQESKNRQAILDLFGIEFPEVEVPSSNSSEELDEGCENDNDEDNDNMFDD